MSSEHISQVTVKPFLILLVIVLSSLPVSCVTLQKSNKETELQTEADQVSKDSPAAANSVSMEGSVDNGILSYDEPVYSPRQSDVFTDMVRTLVNDEYSFFPVGEDIKMKDIVWVWENTNRSLEIQFMEYLVGEKELRPEIVLAQLASQDQARRLALFLSEVKKDDPDSCVRAFEDGVVVIASRAQMARIEQLFRADSNDFIKQYPAK